MTITDLLDRIKRTLKEEQSAIAEGMLLGRMQDFEAYKKSVGIAEGLERAYMIIDEVMKKLDEDE